MRALHSRLKVSVFKLAAFSVKTGHYLKQFRIYQEEYVKCTKKVGHIHLILPRREVHKRQYPPSHRPLKLYGVNHYWRISSPLYFLDSLLVLFVIPVLLLRLNDAILSFSFPRNFDHIKANWLFKVSFSVERKVLFRNQVIWFIFVDIF